MKLATLDNGTRDGSLVVVSRDLERYVPAGGAAPTLQAALDEWDALSPGLLKLSDDLNAGAAAGAKSFDPTRALAPLPRAFQWLDASAFLSHGRLMDVAFDRTPNPEAESIPMIYQGGSDDFLGAAANASFPDDAAGIDLEAEFGVILADTPMGVTPDAAMTCIRLAVLINDWSLRGHGPREMKTGFGFLQAKPATAFAPVAVTPDELGDAWRGGRIHLAVDVNVRGEHFGRPSGAGMSFSIGSLIAHAAATRRLRAGTILGFGTVSNDDAAIVGSACIAERRALDTIAGRAPTPYLAFGECVRIEARSAEGSTIFGAIKQTVVRAPGAAPMGEKT